MINKFLVSREFDIILIGTSKVKAQTIGVITDNANA